MPKIIFQPLMISNPSGRLAGCVFESVGTPAASGLVLEAMDRGRDSAYTVHEI